MQSLSLDIWSRPLAPAERPLFAGAIVPRHNWGPAAAGSIALHVLVVAGTLLAQTYLPMLYPDSLEGVYTARIVPLRVSQRLYYYVEPQTQRPAPRDAAPAAPRRANLRLPPRIRIPVLPEPPRANSLLIQPSSQLAQLLAPMPAITAWAPRDRPAPKTFVQPGRARTLPERPALDAPPTLDRPSMEPRVSALNIPRLPSLRPPALQLPPSSTAPVRLLEPPKLSDAAENAGIGRAGGDPANLIAVGPAVLPPDSYVTVPPGVAGAPTGSAAGSSAGSGPGAAANGNAALQGPLIEVNVEAQRDLPPGVKPIVRPKDGKYNFMVMGSKPGESFPEAAGLLSGTLVYTVYLGIGARADWTLQYCLPKGPQAAGTGTPGPLQAPYAYFMARPQVSFESDDEHLFVHGIIDFTGKFQQLAIVGDAVVGNKQGLLASLYLWQFRPAMRDGRPTAVEVLLIIPRPQP